MNLILRNQKTWNPFQEFEQLQDDMNRLLGFSLSHWPEQTGLFAGDNWIPAVDVLDSKDSLVIKADVPGLSKDDIEVTVQDRHLIIKGEKKYEDKKEEKNYIREERHYGLFQRSIPLSSEVETEKIKATYQNGVLELTLPKKEEAKPKQIPIEVK